MHSTKSTIPAASEKQLKLFDLSLRTAEWKKEFYNNQIKLVASNMIEKNFYQLNPLEKVYALKKLVNDFFQKDKISYHDKEGILENLFSHFGSMAEQNFPPFVFSRLSHKRVKKVVEKAYQELILLEIIYSIEKILEGWKLKATEKQNKASIELQIWVKKISNQLTPSFFTQYSHITIKIKNIFFGLFFENIYLWTTQTVPYFIGLFFNNLWHGGRRLRHNRGRHSVAFKNLGLIALQSVMIPIALIIAVLLQINSVINILFAPTLEILKSVLSRFTGVPFAISVIKFFFVRPTILLLTTFTFFPIIGPMLLFVTIVSFAVGIIVPLCVHTMTKRTSFSEDKSPFIGYSNFMGLILSTVCPWITPMRVNGVIDKIDRVRAHYPALPIDHKESLENIHSEDKNKMLKKRMDWFNQDCRQLIDEEFFATENAVFKIIEKWVKKWMAKQLQIEPHSSLTPSKKSQNKDKIIEKV